MRRLVSLTALLFLSPMVSAAEDKPLVLRWHGQSFFEIVTPAGTRIVIDPHAIEAYGRKEMEADLVLISHFHSDHTQLGIITNANRARVLYGLKETKTENGRRED